MRKETQGVFYCPSLHVGVGFRISLTECLPINLMPQGSDKQNFVFQYLLAGQDKNHTGIDNRCVSSWFCSHPVGSYLWDQERTTDPYQDRPSFHLTIAQ